MKKSDIQFWAVIAVIYASMLLQAYMDGKLMVLIKTMVSSAISCLIAIKILTILKARRGG